MRTDPFLVGECKRPGCVRSGGRRRDPHRTARRGERWSWPTRYLAVFASRRHASPARPERTCANGWKALEGWLKNMTPKRENNGSTFVGSSASEASASRNVSCARSADVARERATASIGCDASRPRTTPRDQRAAQFRSRCRRIRSLCRSPVRRIAVLLPLAPRARKAQRSVRALPASRPIAHPKHHFIPQYIPALSVDMYSRKRCSAKDDNVRCDQALVGRKYDL